MGKRLGEMQAECEDPTAHFGLTGQGLDGSTDFLDKDNNELKDMDKEIIRIEKEKSFEKWTKMEQERQQKVKNVAAKKRLERRAAPGKERERQQRMKEQLEEWADSDSDNGAAVPPISPDSKKRQKTQKEPAGIFSRHKKKKRGGFGL